jgi:hypothetical protein
LGNITDETVRNKYLLREIPHEDIAILIKKSLTATEKQEKMRLFQELTDAITNKFGGFCIDGFKFKTEIEGLQ